MLVALIFVLLLPGAPVQAAAQPYLVQATNATEAARLVEWYGGQVVASLGIINGVSARLTDAALAQLRANPAVKLTADGAVEKVGSVEPVVLPKRNGNFATDFPDETGANLVQEEGVTGAGVTVAILDTGIEPVPTLAKNSNHQPRLIGWRDFVTGKDKPFDDNGHGTHVAGIIANADLGGDDQYNGVAPDVNLVVGRVLDENGQGTYDWVLQGLQWVLDNKDAYQIKVLNLSLLAAVQSPYWVDPLNQAVERLWAAGITVVTAAGNTGPDAMTIGVPGNDPYVITVGAFTDKTTPDQWGDDILAEFSSAGPTHDGFVKPDLVAPGSRIVSLMKTNSVLARDPGAASRITGQYYSMAGTSQSAAVVTGVAALILSQYPDLTPNQLKFRLMATAMPWLTYSDETGEYRYSMWQQGAGRVNAYDAVLAPEFTSDDGQLLEANVGLDIDRDLSSLELTDSEGNPLHYEGFSYFDTDSGEFRLCSIPPAFNQEDGTFTCAEPSEVTLDGFGAWSGRFGAWSGGFGAWSGRFGAWSGGFGAWSGRFGAWSGGFGAWSGGFGAWSGGFGAWSGWTDKVASIGDIVPEQ